MDTSTTNKGVIYVIILTVAFMAVLCVATVCWMAYQGKDASQGLNLLTGGLVGSLTSMLVKTSPTQATGQTAEIPSQVHVTNKPDDPVPTTTEIKA